MRENMVLHSDDSVATALKPLSGGYRTSVEAGKKAFCVEIKGDVPFGHKFALRDMATGDLVIKYGHPIGRITKPVLAGESVHVENMESLRGRGDLETLS